MRKYKKTVTGLLAAILAFVMVPMPAMAAETYGYEVSVNPSPASVGEEVTLTFRLTDYNEAKSGIRGFQIDLADVDDVLQEAVCTALVADTEDLLSNTAKYQQSRDIVRHAYVKLSGAMAYGETALLEVKFIIPEIYTAAGTLSLPLKVLIQNEAGDRITYTDTVDICYTLERSKGNFNGDRVVDEQDAIYLLWHTMFPTLYPISISGDLNGDGNINDADVIHLLWHVLFPDAFPL